MGFDIDLIKSIFYPSKFQLLIKYFPREEALRRLKKGAHVNILADMIKTKETDSIYDFSEIPYLKDTVKIFMKSAKIKLYSKLKNQRIGITKNISIRDTFLLNNNNLIYYDFYYDLLLELLKDKIDACIGQEKIINFYIKTLDLSGLESLNKSLNVIKYYFACEKGDRVLLNVLNEGLFKVKKDGTYKKIYDKWFNGNNQ